MHVTNTQIAQKVVHMIAAGVIGGQIANQIENHTDLESDDLLVTIPSYVAAELIARQTDKITDPIVEKTFGRIRNWRQSRKAAVEVVTESAA